MDNDSEQAQTFKDILTNQAFDRLEEFKDASKWTSLKDSDRELLATLFVLQGETELVKGDSRVLDSFDLANQICPKNPKILIQQAKAFATQDQHIHCLTHAQKTVEKILTIDPNYFEALQLWGSTLVKIGVFYQEAQHFHEADRKFSYAQELLINNVHLTGEFYWNWGLCWYHLGKHSGEAVDLHRAVNHFRLAAEADLQTKNFWNDYGNALVDLSFLIGRPEFLPEAVEFYLKAIKAAPDYFEGWLNYAISLQQIHSVSNKLEHFETAHEGFAQASKINADDVTLWLKWGQLLVDFSKRSHCLEHLHESLEKFKKADACEPNHPLVLSRWAEVLMILGTYEERLELLRDAENKLMRSLEIFPESSEIWYLYGACLIELGRYFGDEEFYFQAIEKFEHGLSINRQLPSLWYGLASSYFAIGEMQEDAEMLQKAIRYYNHVSEFDVKEVPQLWNDWGVALMKLAEMSNEHQYIRGAVEKFERTLQLHEDEPSSGPINPEWLYNYGCALDFLGDFEEDARYYEKSIQVLMQVLQSDPEYTFARFNLALALAHLAELTSDIESFQKALDCFQDILSHDPEDEMAWNEWGLTLINYAQLIQDPSHPDLSQKIYELAEKKLLQAIAMGSVTAFYNLSCLYSLYGNHSAAMYYIERAEKQGGLPALEDLLNDDWLDSLRQTPMFRNFINHLTTKQSNEDKA